MLVQALLVACGGALVGYGFAFPFKWPPHQMILGMIGMFAVQAWQSGSSFGLIFYICVTALFGGLRAIHNFRADRTSTTIVHHHRPNNPHAGAKLRGE